MVPVVAPTLATNLVLDRRAPNGSPFAPPFALSFSAIGWKAFSKNRVDLLLLD